MVEIPARRRRNTARREQPGPDTEAVENRIRALSDHYDHMGEGEGTLAESTLRRLHVRQAASGKTCERCQVRKPLSAFSIHARNRDALRNYCRECANKAEKLRVNGQSGAPMALSISEKENL